MGNNKDYYDKSLKFSHEGKLYYFCSQIAPNELELKPCPAKTDRGKTMIGVQIFERIGDKIVLKGIS